MKYINLVFPEKSDPVFTISEFPDGQVNASSPVIYSDESYRITSRMSSYKDLYKIKAVNQVLRDANVQHVELYCPYVLAARSDRKFQEYQSFDLKLVAQDINFCKFDKVFVLDPHSDVLPALIENCDPFDVLTGWLSWIKNPTHFWENKTLISPDAGAFKKLFKISEQLNVPLITGSKVRIDGKIDVVFHGNVNGKECVIVDDICDGGRTFVQLASKLKDLGASKVILMVTHGIFSNGLTLEGVDEIYTTNSYREFDLSGISDRFHVINVY